MADKEEATRNHEASGETSTVSIKIHLDCQRDDLYDISPRENKAMSYILNVFININSVLSVQDIRKLKLSETRV